MDEENRSDVVAEVLRPVLEEGEAYSVFCHDGEIHVKETDTSVCAVRHPRLYGRLLSVSAQLDQAGAGLGRVPTIVALAFCVGVHLHWWNDWLGNVLIDQLDHVLFFLLVFFIVFQGLSIIKNVLRRSVYQRNREEVFVLLASEKLDRDTLLAMIEGDPAVGRAGYYLKLDAAASRVLPQLADRV